MKNLKEGKRLLLICLLGLFSFSAGFGQAGVIVLILGDKVATESFYLSIDGALNISSLKGIDGSERCFGVNYGLGVHIKLGEKWHLKPEFKPLSRKGATSIDPITSVSADITVDKTKLKLNYIDVPVFIQYNITPLLYISTGPQISFMTDVNQFSSGASSDGTEASIKVNVKSYFNKTNYSFPVEAGYSLFLGSKRSTTKLNVNVFARYEYGFMEIFKDPAVGSSKVSLIQVGLSLPFIKKPGETAQTK